MNRKGSLPDASATDAIGQDAFDRMIFAEVLEEIPAAAELVDRLSYDYSYVRDLVADLYASFYQPDPAVRPAGHMRADHLLNHAVISALHELPETAETRIYTTQDQYGATLATLAVSERVPGLLAEQQQRLDEKQEALQKAQNALAEAVERATASSSSEPSLDGDKAATEGQVAEAQQGVDDALMELEATAASAATRVQSTVRAAVREAGQRLAEEAAGQALWGAGPGDLRKLDFAERSALSRKLTTPTLKAYADQLGRFRDVAVGAQARRTRHGRDEMVDVEPSDRLPDVLASEFALLTTEVGTAEFMRRFAARQLLSYAYRGSDRKGAGGLVVCCDTSSSMTIPSGRGGITRDMWSKAFALSLAERARKERRDFVGILFADTQPRVFRFTKGRFDLPLMIEFIETFLGGGTDYVTPLDLASKIIEEELSRGDAQADCVFITDDDCRVPEAWLTQHVKRRETAGFRTWGVMVGSRRIAETLQAVSTNVRSVTDMLDTNAVADMYQAI